MDQNYPRAWGANSFYSQKYTNEYPLVHVSFAQRAAPHVKPVTCCHLVVSFAHKPQTGAGDSRDVDNEDFQNSRCNDDEWCEKWKPQNPRQCGQERGRTRPEAEPLPCSWTARQLFLRFVTAQWYFLVCCSPLFLLHYSHLTAAALLIKMWLQNTREASEWSYTRGKTRETKLSIK